MTLSAQVPIDALCKGLRRVCNLGDGRTAERESSLFVAKPDHEDDWDATSVSNHTRLQARSHSYHRSSATLI
jgi:acetaldehyde dehydrogenase (acetylating)